MDEIQRIDRVRALRLTAVIATSVGFLVAIVPLLPIPYLFNLRAGLIIGPVLIVVGAIAGHLARRARPRPVTITQLVWRIAPTIGCLIGCIYALVVLGNPFGQYDSGASSMGFLALAGVGALGGTFCAFGAWLARRVLARIIRNDAVLVAAGSIIGGVVGFVLLNSRRPTSLWALIFVVLVTVALLAAVAFRAWRRPSGQ